MNATRILRHMWFFLVVLTLMAQLVGAVGATLPLAHVERTPPAPHAPHSAGPHHRTNTPTAAPAAPRAVLSWTGADGDGSWGNPRNWAGGRAPGPADVARFAGDTPDARLEVAETLGGLVLEASYKGTLHLEDTLMILGDLALSGGELHCGTAPLEVQGVATITGGLLTTPAGAAMNAVSLHIAAPGIVRMGRNGKLNLSGDGEPLTGDGLLDTTTSRPNSVEYTGRPGADLTAAGPAAGLHQATPEGFRRVGSLPLARAEDHPYSVVIDPAAGFAYFGTTTSPGIVVKVDLSTFTRVGALNLEPEEYGLLSAVIDPAAGFAYFGTASSPGIVVKVDLSTFTRAGALTLEPGEDDLLSAVIDPAAGFAYFGTWTSPGRVVQVDLSTFTRTGALTLEPGEYWLHSAVIDPAAGFAYFGTATYPGIVVKVDLSTFTRAGALTLEPGEGGLSSAVIDPAAGFAYFGTWTFPDRVVQVDLSSFARAGALTLEPGEVGLGSAVIDPAAGFAYFGTATSPGIVVKVDIATFNRAPLADAGPDQLVELDTLVSLDGRGSIDPDEHYPLTYHWTQTGGPAVTFDDTLSMTTFLAPPTEAVLTFTLAVTDSLGLACAVPDEVVVRVRTEVFRFFLYIVIKS